VSVERQALGLVGDVYGLLEIEEFRTGLLSALREVVPSDWASLNEVGSTPAEIFSIVEPPLEEGWHDVWAKHGLQNPLVAHFSETLDGRPFRFSDVVSQAELHELDLYRKLYGPIGLEHQIAFTLPARSEQILGVALSRREHDFSDSERELLQLARPHLIQAYNNAVHHSRLLHAHLHGERLDAPPIAELLTRGLTRREAEVVSLAARGSADREIAHELRISHRTVQKHLQHAYAKLGVGGRAEAAAISFAERRPGPAAELAAEPSTAAEAPVAAPGATATPAQTPAAESAAA
jgi:DNA-binding CsgD family transcriptional regulator